MTRRRPFRPGGALVATAGLAVVLASSGCVGSGAADERAGVPSASPGLEKSEPADPSDVQLMPNVHKFADEHGIALEGLVYAAVRDARRLLPTDSTGSVALFLDDSRAIPGIGIGGYASPKGNVQISIDPAADESAKARFADWLPILVAYELHHSARIRRGPGFGSTLGEMLVSEGLADAFAREVNPNGPEIPWRSALSQEGQAALWPSVRENWSQRSDFRRWFWGTTSDIPPWAGYTLGSIVVERQLATLGLSAADAFDLDAAGFRSAIPGDGGAPRG